MGSSTSHFDQPIPLSKIRASYHAWNAVRDDMPLKEFLDMKRCTGEVIIRYGIWLFARLCQSPRLGTRKLPVENNDAFPIYPGC
jgi:hypothetical protein